MSISLDGQIFSCWQQFPGSTNRGHQVTAWTLGGEPGAGEDLDLPAGLPPLPQWRESASKDTGHPSPARPQGCPLCLTAWCPGRRASSRVCKTSFRWSHSLRGLWNPGKLFTRGHDLLHFKDEVKNSSVKKLTGLGPGASFWLSSPGGVAQTALTSPGNDV